MSGNFASTPTPIRLYWFSLGIGSSALILGVLVGASQSPVAGVAITATFGVVAAALAVWQKSAIERKLELISTQNGISDTNTPSFQSAVETLGRIETDIRDALNRLGRLLVLFSLAFILGIILGAQVRVGQWPKKNLIPKTFPWANSEAPGRIEDAVDWIVVQERLRDAGFSQGQISNLYALQIKEWKEHPLSRVNPFAEKKPLSSLLSSLSSAAPAITQKQKVDLDGLIANKPSRQDDGPM